MTICLELWQPSHVLLANCYSLRSKHGTFRIHVNLKQSEHIERLVLENLVVNWGNINLLTRGTVPKNDARRHERSVMCPVLIATVLSWNAVRGSSNGRKPCNCCRHTTPRLLGWWTDPWIFHARPFPSLRPADRFQCLNFQWFWEGH